MLFKQIAISLFLLFIYFQLYAQESHDDILFEKTGYTFPYRLNKPAKEWKLPKELVEISGLSYIGKHLLAGIQDEKGNIYIFNTKKGEVVKKINFGDKGDYEGIEVVGEDAWVLKSNGTLYRVKDFMKDNEPKVHKYKTPLSGINNTEGLGYDPIEQNLLIACKGHPFFKGYNKGEAREFKSVYRFNIKTKQFEIPPVLLIALDSIKQHLNYNTMTSLGVELLAFFDEAEGDVSFQPSGIAIHPESGNLYILASVGNLLAVFNKKGELLALIHLRHKVHKQPEGICFTPKGTLYISNEGDNEKGMILKFNENSY